MRSFCYLRKDDNLLAFGSPPLIQFVCFFWIVFVKLLIGMSNSLM